MEIKCYKSHIRIRTTLLVEQNSLGFIFAKKKVNWIDHSEEKISGNTINIRSSNVNHGRLMIMYSYEYSGHKCSLKKRYLNMFHIFRECVQSLQLHVRLFFISVEISNKALSHLSLLWFLYVSAFDLTTLPLWLQKKGSLYPASA